LTVRNRKRGTQRRLVPDRQEHVNFSRRELTIVFFVAFDVRCLDIVECEIPAFLIAEFGHPLEKIRIMWGVSGLHTDKADAQHLWLLLRPRRERPGGCRAADERYKLAPPIKKTRSHGTIAKRIGSAKRPRLAKGLPFSSSWVGRRPVGNSLDHLVGDLLEMQWHVDTKCFGSLDIDDQLEFCGLLDRQVGRLLALENPADIRAGQTMRILKTSSVAHQTTGRSMLAEGIDRRYCVTRCQRGELFA